MDRTRLFTSLMLLPSLSLSVEVAAIIQLSYLWCRRDGEIKGGSIEPLNYPIIGHIMGIIVGYMDIAIFVFKLCVPPAPGAEPPGKSLPSPCLPMYLIPSMVRSIIHHKIYIEYRGPKACIVRVPLYPQLPITKARKMT